MNTDVFLLVLAYFIPCYQAVSAVCSHSIKVSFQEEIISQVVHRNECFYCSKVTWKVHTKSGMPGAPLSLVLSHKSLSVKFGSCEHPVSLFWKQNWTHIDVYWNHYFSVITKSSVSAAHIIFWSHHCIKSIKREEERRINKANIIAKQKHCEKSLQQDIYWVIKCTCNRERASCPLYSFLS